MLEIIEQWNALNLSKIEGLEPINVAFRTMITQVKKRPYDVLNTRRNEFDTDFTQFRRDIEDLRIRLQDFLDKKFEEIPRLLPPFFGLSYFFTFAHRLAHLARLSFSRSLKRLKGLALSWLKSTKSA